MTKAQVNRRLANYLRTHRRNAGLTQPELGHILGHCNEGPVFRHERFQAMPSLVVALGYEIIFRAPVSDIFAGLHDEVEEHVEERLAAFENDLQQRSAKGRNADAIAKKLTWLSERRMPGNESRE